MLDTQSVHLSLAFRLTDEVWKPFWGKCILVVSACMQGVYH
jgi:hypothetical protein